MSPTTTITTSPGSMSVRFKEPCMENMMDSNCLDPTNRGRHRRSSVVGIAAPCRRPSPSPTRYRYRSQQRNLCASSTRLGSIPGTVAQSTLRPLCEKFSLTLTLYGVITALSADNSQMTHTSPIDTIRMDPSLGALEKPTHRPLAMPNCGEALGQPIFRFVHNADLSIMCRALGRGGSETAKCAVRWCAEIGRRCSDTDQSSVSRPLWRWIWLTVRRVGDEMICTVNRPIEGDDDDHDSVEGALSTEAARHRRHCRSIYNGLSGLLARLMLSGEEDTMDSEYDSDEYDDDDDEGGDDEGDYDDHDNHGDDEEWAGFSTKSEETSAAGSMLNWLPVHHPYLADLVTVQTPTQLVSTLVGWTGAALGQAVQGVVSRYTTTTTDNQ